jgi:hypothetical protein
MSNPSKYVVHDPVFLRMLIDLNHWEGSIHNEFQTDSSRELFFQIAESVLSDTQAPKYQTLKFLAGRLTERAMRQRVREFQALGLATVTASLVDSRTKQLVPTKEFIAKLNQHVLLRRQICDRHMFLIDKV